MRRAAGFTLIEILVVVFIIGLLATIVSVNVIGQTDNARITKAKVDLKEIEQGLHLYKLDNGIYPTTDQGLAALVRKPSGGPQPRKYNPEGYIGKIPEDPWGNPYVITVDLNNDGKSRDAFYRARSIAQITSGAPAGYFGLFNSYNSPSGNGDHYECNSAVMVWSAGPDKMIDPKTPANTGVNKDNVVSWK